MWRAIQSFVRRLKPSLSPKTTTFSEEFLGKALGEIQKGNLEKARSILDELLQKEPEHLQALVYYGMAAMPRDFAKAGNALDKALSLDPKDPGALSWTVDLRWMQKDWGSAIDLLKRLVKLHPSPHQWYRLGLLYKEAGGSEEAKAAFREAAGAASTGFPAKLSFKERARRLFYLHQLGEAEAFTAEIEDLYGKASKNPAWALPESLKSLRKCFRGKNLLVLATGPSLGLLDQYLADLDPDERRKATTFGFNNVPVTQQKTMENHLGSLNAVLLSHPQVAKLHEEWLLKFMDDPQKVFCLPQWALSDSSALSKCAEDRPSQFLFYNSSEDHPPIPEDPFHFPPVNTLMHVLAISLISQPRKIFLFGCDGGTQVGKYFQVGDTLYGNQLPPGDTYEPWLRKDTFYFDEMIHPLLQATAHLWRSPIPPIFNCYPESGFRAFPKINPSRFLAEFHS
jgi:tetratricopeptide (TPR) repeat protein